MAAIRKPLDVEPCGTETNLGQCKPNARNHQSMSYASAIIVLIIALLVVVSPLASARPTPANSVTVGPPYSGSAVSFKLLTLEGCGVAKIPVKPTFNLTTGISKGSASLSMKSCGSKNGSGSLTIYAGLGESPTFITSTSGKMKVAAHWKFDYTVSVAAKVGGPGEYAECQVDVGAIAFVIDQTLDEYYTIGENENVFYCTSTPTTYTESYSFTIGEAFDFVAGHSYYLMTYVFGNPLVYVSTGTSTASGSVNFGTAGEHGKLIAYVIP